MTPIAEHKCDQVKESGYDIVKFYGDKGWIFDMGEYWITDIKYCPYCGKQLENE